MNYLLVTIAGFVVGFLINYLISKIEKEKKKYKPGLAEALTVLTFLFVFSHYYPLEDIKGFVFSLIISSFLVVIFIYDLKHLIIPNKVIYPAIVTTGLYLFFLPQSVVLNHLFSAIGAFLFFTTIYYATKEKGMGFGDVRFSFFMGLMLGYPGIIIGLFFSFFLGSIMGLVFMILGKKGRKSALPFAPFLIAGTFIAWFYGDQILHIYLNFYV